MTGLGSDDLAAVEAALAPADALLSQYPGERPDVQPVHTVYVSAAQAAPGVCAEWGGRALALLAEHAPSPADAEKLLPGAAEVYPRVVRALHERPVQDLRIDFEDGYGHPADDSEDAAAAVAARVLADAAAGPDAPLALGIRFKGLEPATRRRGLRTLDLLVGALLDRAGALPAGFVVTLPKVTSVSQVRAMVIACERLEAAYALSAGTLKFEIQVETPQAVLGADGAATVARMVHAAAGRCTALHYGTFDYSAGLGIAAAYQSLEHPAADHAKAVMQVAVAGTGVWVCDGSTNVLPVGGRDDVMAAWRLHTRLVTRSLERGYYQGWDMHPGHLVSRYLATFAFFRGTFPAAAARVRGYLDGAAGGVMDEPATARALAAALLRGVECGAIDEPEATHATGTSVAQLHDLRT